MLTLFALILSGAILLCGGLAAVLHRMYLSTHLKHFLYFCGAFSMAVGTIAPLLIATIARAVGTVHLSSHVFLAVGLGAFFVTCLLFMMALYYGFFREFADVRSVYKSMRVSDWWRGKLPSHVRLTHEPASIQKRKGVTFGAMLLVGLVTYVALSDFLRISLQRKEPLAFLVTGFLVLCCVAIVVLSLVYGDSGNKKQGGERVAERE